MKRYDKERTAEQSVVINGIFTFTKELGEEFDAIFEADDTTTLSVCQKKTAKRNSADHKKGDVYLESRSMDADYFGADLKQIGQKIRQQYVELGHGQVRVSLQNDSAGGHGMARGDRIFSSLAAMMDANYSIELVR